MKLDTRTTKRIQAGALKAAQLASLCDFLSQALGADPDTSGACDAIDGLGALAISLSNDLSDITEDTDTSER